MNNIGLKTRLAFAVGFLTLLMLGLAAIGYLGMRDAERNLSASYDDQVLPLVELKTVSDAYAVTVATTCRQLADDDLAWAQGRQTLAAAKARADAAWRAFNASHLTDRERAIVGDAATVFAHLDRMFARLQEVLQHENRDELKQFNATDLPGPVAALSAKIDQLSEFQRAEVADKVAANASDDGSLKVELLVTTGVAVVLAIIIGIVLNRILADLNALIRQVQAAGVQVSTSVTEVAATAKEQQATANEIAATTSEIGATSKEISATSKELVKAMGDVSKGAEQTAELAGSGHSGLGRMEEMMRHVMEAAGAINAKLAVLNEKAGNINQVVTTITKVADQTNLLSLNAAIEAEKAGEFGRGFSVVATEIRRLADQTAVATYDIEQIVKEMLSAVSASVMGMDKFSEEVRRGVDEVRNVGAQLTQIIEHVQALTPRFETVNEGMQAQATGAQQISEALGQLSEAAQQTVDSLRQSNAAIEQLNETARTLRTGVERIRT